MGCDGLRKQIWEGMLDADYRTRYFGEIASRLGAQRLNLNIAFTVLSSGAFVSLIGKVGHSIPEICVLVSVVLGCITILKGFGEMAYESASFFRQWAIIESEYRTLWTLFPGLKESEVIQRWEAILAKEKVIGEHAALRFRFDRQLANRCYDEMLSARNLLQPEAV